MSGHRAPRRDFGIHIVELPRLLYYSRHMAVFIYVDTPPKKYPKCRYINKSYIEYLGYINLFVRRFCSKDHFIKIIP